MSSSGVRWQGTDQLLELTFQACPIPLFAIDCNGLVILWNRACEQFTGVPAGNILGSDRHWQVFYPDATSRRPTLADLVLENRQAVIFDYYATKQHPQVMGKQLQAEGWLREQGGVDRYSVFTAVPVRNAEGELLAVVETFQDLTDKRQISQELEQAYENLKSSQVKVLQTEKMASIGQLAAGVAHEINNPIGFVKSNLSTFSKYVERLNLFLEKLDDWCKSLPDSSEQAALSALRKELKVDFILEDTAQLLEESREGIERVRKIVQDLKSFSRIDEAALKLADLNECLESTLNIVWNELKYKATVEKDLASLPEMLCNPQQINQVLLNLLINAGQAIEKQGAIRIRTWHAGGRNCIAISDSGGGIAEENLGRLFDPFFTTKDVGQGTGLGLSISYDIVSNHGGEILVDSRVGQGTTFTVCLPCVVRS